MRKLIAFFTACSILALALLASPAAQSQEARWFRVEVLVFTNPPSPAPGGAATAEQWDPIPALSYPGAARFLVDPARVRQFRSSVQGDGVLDDYGRLIITLTNGPRAPGPTEIPVRPGPVYSPAPETNTDPAPAATAPAMAAPAGSLPRPFVLLPAAYLEFRGKAALMQRSGQYSTLFHQAWVQPVSDEGSSLPIILDYSGDTGQWPRLQGSLKIYLSRYLHVDTDLWLNTAGEYLPGTWHMPAPPLGPPSLIVEEIEPVYIGPPAEQPAGEATQEPVETAALTAGADSPVTTPAEAASGPAEAEEVTPGPVYPYRHAVLLQQKRRMRSNEVHYIDHPLLGMIVKFTPVTGEVLADIAREQAASLKGLE